MKIVIETADVAPIWGKAVLLYSDMQELVSECLNKTFTRTDNVFLSVSFIDNVKMTALNNEFRGKNNSTNVLSFANCGADNVFYGKTYRSLFLGELFFCFEKIQEEAAEYSKVFHDRLAHLFVHGVLHLLGYDHIVDSERERMERLEEEILKRFNIFDIYTC